MKKDSDSVDNIVVATDFSKVGDWAVSRAALIAKALERELHMLHVVSPLDLYPELMSTFSSKVKHYEHLKQASGMDSLDKLAAVVRREYDIKAKTAVRIGRTHVQIADYVNEHKADLVVVGFHGKRTVGAGMGSTAYRLLRAADCPILIVKNENVVSYRQVIAAVDFKLGSSGVPTLACKIAPAAEVELLHIFDKEQETFLHDISLVDEIQIEQHRDESLKRAKNQLDAILTGIGQTRAKYKILQGYLPEEICMEVSSSAADLIVLGKQSKSNMQEFLLGSVSKSVADRVACDVLLA